MIEAKKHKAILVVEDDALIRNDLIEILKEEGYRAFGAGNGQEAIDYLNVTEALPSLILLDMMMPLMNGWQFRSEQEKSVRLLKIPVVVVTADGNARQKAKNMSASGWVKKPIDIDELLTVVQKCAVRD